MAKAPKQVDQAGYNEGYHTGISKGYKHGMLDALKVVQDLLEDNGVNLRDSEFKIQFDTMVEEGSITPPPGVL